MTTDNPFARYVTDAAVDAAGDAIEAATGYVTDGAVRAALLAALAIVGPEIRREALEEAAKECERQKEIFASPQYATGQPLSSLHERVACNTCAAAIRALGKEG